MGTQSWNLLLLLLLLLLLMLRQNTTDVVGLLCTYCIRGRFTSWTMKLEQGRWFLSMVPAKQVAARMDSSYVCMLQPVHGIRHGNSVAEFVVVVADVAVEYYRRCGVIIYVSYSRSVYIVDHEVGARKMVFNHGPCKASCCKDGLKLRMSVAASTRNSTGEFSGGICCCCCSMILHTM